MWFPFGSNLGLIYKMVKDCRSWALSCIHQGGWGSSGSDTKWQNDFCLISKILMKFSKKKGKRDNFCFNIDARQAVLVTDGGLI